MAYRRGDAAAWQADPQGVQLMDVPFYLAQAEYTGIADIQIAMATRAGDEQVAPIAPQAAAVAAKALNLVKLQRKAVADKKVAIFFWNYPAGEKNLSASFMNLPRSLSGTLSALQQDGYRTEEMAQAPLTALLQRLLAPAYRPPEDREVLRALLRDGLAERLPVARYRAWLQSLPPQVQQALQQRWGAPERSTMVLSDGGQPFFVVPRLRLGQVTLLPQPGRDERGSERDKALYHSRSAVPAATSTWAVYLWGPRTISAPIPLVALLDPTATRDWLPRPRSGDPVRGTNWAECLLLLSNIAGCSYPPSIRGNTFRWKSHAKVHGACGPSSLLIVRSHQKSPPNMVNLSGALC